MTHQHFDHVNPYDEIHECNCKDCRQKRHHRFDHKDDFCACKRDVSFSNRRQQMNHHHSDCNSCKSKIRNHSFYKIPSLRKQRLEPQHADSHVKLSHINRGDKQSMNPDCQENRLKVIHEDGKKNIIIIM